MYKTVGKKILSFLLVISALLSFSAINANAAISNVTEIMPYYTDIGDTITKLSISGIVSTCTATLKSSKSQTLSIKMELQKEKSSGYETIKTWTSSTTGTYLTMSEKRNINIFSDYRLKVTFTAGSEIKIVYAYPN